MALRIAILGCTAAGRAHARAYLSCPDVELVACADPKLADAMVFRDRLHVANAYDSVQELLDLEQPDAVSICVPAPDRARVAELVIRAKIPALCCMPASIVLPDSEWIAEHTSRQHPVVAMAAPLHESGAATQLKRALSCSELGTAWYGTCRAVPVPWRRAGTKAPHRCLSAPDTLLRQYETCFEMLECVLWAMDCPTPAAISGMVYDDEAIPEQEAGDGAARPGPHQCSQHLVGLVKFVDGRSLLLELGWETDPATSSTSLVSVAGSVAIATLRRRDRQAPSLLIRSVDGTRETRVTPDIGQEEALDLRMIRHWVSIVTGGADASDAMATALNAQRILDALYVSCSRQCEIAVEVPS